MIEMQSAIGARAVVNGRECDYFGGTGYLGLQTHPDLLKAARDALTQYGLSTAAGIRLGHPIYKELARAACAFFDAERALYFASGYLGAMILAQGLTEQYDRIFIDESAHYSVRDGVRSTGKPVTFFHHLDANNLAEVCHRELKPGERPLVLSDGVFPSTGEIAPVSDLLEIVERYDGLVCLDDAHAVGVLGERGRGTFEYLNIVSERGHSTCTLSKAMGAYGGLIAGNATFIETLERHALLYRAATPPPLPVAAAATCALDMQRRDPILRRQLLKNVARVRAGLRSLGWMIEDTPVPIICLRSRPGLDLAQLQSRLFERDILVAHVTEYSSVPAGGAIRIAIFATHTSEQIDRLIAEVRALV
jgi:8-amino-7-oxononanoate synthase